MGVYETHEALMQRKVFDAAFNDGKPGHSMPPQNRGLKQGQPESEMIKDIIYPFDLIRDELFKNM